MDTKLYPEAAVNAKMQRHEASFPTPETQSDFSASWGLGFLALDSVRAAMLAALIALLPCAAQAQGAIEAWVQRYDGPANRFDAASQLAVDTNGNVYVTGISHGGDPLYGGSSGDYATIKYSSAGVPLWTNYYNGIANGFDEANAIALDSEGNAVVTGSEDSGSGSVVATIKYSSDGIPLWTNRQSPGVGFVMALDASNNVIVNGFPGCLTLKYSSAGALLWSRTYSDYNRPSGRSVTLAVDSSGNVFVVGGTSSYPPYGEYQTIKYSSAGVLLWTRRYKGPGVNVSSYANAVAVDASGNVYVTGQSAGTGGSEGHYDFATIKYSGAGVPLWTNCYNGPGAGTGAGNDCAMAIAVDPNTNVVVTGWSGGFGGIDYLTIKYSNAGVPLWTNRLSGGADPSALAVDSRGNAYVTSPSGGDYFTFAYSSSGVPLWTNRYNGPGNDVDSPWSIVADATGSVYVAGVSTGSGSGDDWATVKYVTPAIIARPPLSQTNAVGTAASLSVEAAGNLPLTYQWRLQGTNLADGASLSGVTNASLLIANVQTADAGGYSVVVTNAYGSATSAVAQLTVTIPPSPGRFSNLSYSPATGFSFIFRDASVGQAYRIQRSSSLAEGSWTDWQSFTYTEPVGFLDFSATAATNRFYRAVSP
jgi:hypothetical protein